MVVEKSLRKSLTSMSTASRNIRCRVFSRSAALQNQTMQGLTCCFLVELRGLEPSKRASSFSALTCADTRVAVEL